MGSSNQDMMGRACQDIGEGKMKLPNLKFIIKVMKMVIQIFKNASLYMFIKII